MKYDFKGLRNKPYLISENNIVIEINREFTSLFGYSENEIIGKLLAEISILIRIDSQIYLDNIENECSCYMFTKKYEPREINITCKRLESENEKIFFIEEKANSRIEDILPYASQLLSDNRFGVAICSAERGIVLKVNQENINFMNCGKEEVVDKLGKTVKEIFTESNENNFWNIFSQVMKKENSFYKREMRFSHSKRGEIYLDISLVPIYISGKVKYIVHIAEDVTEKVKNRILIEKQKQELETIIENVSDIIIVFDKNGKYTISNKAFMKNHLFDIKGLTLEDILKKAQYFDEDGNIISYENMPSQRVIKGESFSGYRMDIKNGDCIFNGEVNGTPIYDNDGNFIAGVLVSRNISERLKSEESLLIRAQYDLLSKIVDNLELSIVRYTFPELRIIDFNNKAYNHIKKLNPKVETQECIRGQSIFDIFNENVQIIEAIKRALYKNIYYDIRKHIIDGKEVYYKYICQPLIGMNNEIVEVIVIGIDITDEIQEKIRMEENLKIQDEIFANISHELKTPLNVIFSTNQLMEFYAKNGSFEVNKDKIYNDINIIKQNCYRFIKLINNIVDLSKIDSGFYKLNLRNENIVEIIESIVQSVAEYIKEKGLNIVFDTDIEEQILACDPEKIERIILNLISNAIKFSDYESTIFVNISIKENFVEISVKDTGVGIEEKYLDSIFKRYHQIDKTLRRNVEGSGIGLSLVKSIVELHGGKITVESEVGKGSTFKIQLPIRTIEQPEDIDKNKNANSKVDMINIEFSDIYQ